MTKGRIGQLAGRVEQHTQKKKMTLFCSEPENSNAAHDVTVCVLRKDWQVHALVLL